MGGYVTVLRPGLLTTVQDAGRWGHQEVGVSVSGPMDPMAHRLANVVVGNRPDAATLEATFLGPELRMEQHTRLALAGADWVLFQPALQGDRPNLTTGWPHEHIRPMVDVHHRRLAAHEKAYVTYCKPPFTFYWWRHGRPTHDPDVIWGERHRYRPGDHRPEVEALAARPTRLWCLYSHLTARELATLRALFAEHYLTGERYGEGDVGLDRLVRRGGS